MEVSGNVTGPEDVRSLPSKMVEAPGSASGSRTTRVSLTLPIGDDDPHGVYTVSVMARWTNATTGNTGASGPFEAQIARGAAITLLLFDARTDDDGIRFTAIVANSGELEYDAWVVAQIYQGNDVPFVESSEKVGLVASESQTLDFLWAEAGDHLYRVVARAVFELPGGIRGNSVNWPDIEVRGPASADGGDGSDGGGGADTDLGGGVGILALVAFAGILIGAAVAILVNRRGPRRGARPPAPK